MLHQQILVVLLELLDIQEVLVTYIVLIIHGHNLYNFNYENIQI
jgi:hypothetical protein